MTKFKGKYRIESNRLKTWDYTQYGFYYITILTKYYKNYFGEIRNGKMRLSKYGRVLKEELMRTKQIRDYVELDMWQIMPNHLHLIIILDNPKQKACHESKYLQPSSIGAIIGQLKSIVTKKIRKMGCERFAWQPNYYDHIIRSEKALCCIRKYIALNPLKWEIDQYYN